MTIAHGVEGELNEGIKDNLKLVVSSGKRLSNLINDILDMSKLRKGNIELNFQNVNVKLLAESVIMMSRVQVKKKNIIFENEIPDNLYVYADENKLNQIFYNLLGNAIKFTQNGKIWVEAKERGEYIEIIVGDTGIGIPQDKKDVIFESFFQIESSETRKYSGTGLGLSITKTLVELHGGSIYVDSVAGEGSRFIFTIKKGIFDVGKAVVSENIVRKYQKSSATHEKTREINIEIKTDNKKNILVIDDDFLNIQVIINMTKNEKYNIFYAASGKEGLEVLNTEKIDLLLLDIMMPVLSGYEVAEIIRKSFNRVELPIIFLTARSRTEDIVEAFEKGGNDYLIKPIVKEELIIRINTLLELKDSINQMIESNRKYENEKYMREFTASQDEFIRRLTSTLVIEEVLDRLLGWIKEYIEFDSAAVFLVENNSIDKIVVSGEINQEEFKREFDKYFNEYKERVRLNKAEVVEKLPKKLQDILGSNVDKIVIFPISYEENIIGFVELNLAGEKKIEPDELDILMCYVIQSGLAVENAKLFSKIKKQTKLDTMIKLTGSIVHEIRTPIAVIKGFATMELERRREDEVSAKRMGIIMKETSRIDEMAGELLDYSGIPEYRFTFEIVNLYDIVAQHLENTKYDIESNGVEIAVDIEKKLSIMGDKEKLRRLFEIILKNSIEGIDIKKEKKTIKISGQMRDKIEINIYDNGVGIPKELLGEIFEPLVTTKIQGTGLGLPIARDICRKHNGDIMISSEEGKWTNVTILFPDSKKARENELF